jgi:hypothetical protein
MFCTELGTNSLVQILATMSIFKWQNNWQVIIDICLKSSMIWQPKQTTSPIPFDIYMLDLLIFARVSEQCICLGSTEFLKGKVDRDLLYF